MTTEKPSQNEDEYFARRDAELIQRQRADQVKDAIAAERRTHFMKCPKCGADLQIVELHSIHIDRCPECFGAWLDHGELDIMLRHSDPGFFGRVFGDLFASSRK